jgi:XTP/dITP diphosphohydrolase
MLEIVLATGNPHKVDELRAIFAALPAALGIRVLGLRDLPEHESFNEPSETGSTFEQNASIKAISYAAQTGRPCLADDSGLEIDALAGRPGVISSHYATDGRETGLNRPERDAVNNARVLRELTGVPPERRTARFVCVMALAEPPGPQAGPNPILATSRGTFEGRIGIPPAVPRGCNGFGYDPLFLVAPEFTQTSAELATDGKNALSHRAAAARNLIARLAGIGLLPPPQP